MPAIEVSAPRSETGSVRRADPRARRTRAQLMAALVELATHRDLDEISISELAAEAGVNRATFYLHYSDKEGLLLDAISEVTEEISLGAAAASGEELIDADQAPSHTLTFFAELDRHAALYRRVLGPAGSPAVVAHLRDGIQGAITEEMHHRSAGRIDDRSISRVGAFVAGGVIAAATTWLDDDDRPPADEEAAAVWRMVLASSMPLWDRTSHSGTHHG